MIQDIRVYAGSLCSGYCNALYCDYLLARRPERHCELVVVCFHRAGDPGGVAKAAWLQYLHDLLGYAIYFARLFTGAVLVVVCDGVVCEVFILYFRGARQIDYAGTYLF